MLNMPMVVADKLGSLQLPVTSVERRIEDGRVVGMVVTFPNRMTLSIQWHSGAYSNVGRGFWKPGDEVEVECAAWFPEEFDTPWIVNGEDWGTKRRWFNPMERFQGDDVLPYVTIPTVIEFARMVAAVELDVANFGKAIALVAAR
jgi:hypothetical protein